VVASHRNWPGSAGADGGGALRPESRTRQPFRGGLVTPQWLAALRQGQHPMPATVTIVAGCTGVWIASIATGGSVWSGSVRGPVDRGLARNAVLIASGQWWRALSYGAVNLSVFSLVWVMALLLLAGMQVERTYGTIRFLAVLVPALTTGALTALFVEPAHAFNAGTSGATLGVATAAAIDLLRRGVPWYQTFWVPALAIILVLGLVFPAGVTWGAHAGGILAGAIMGFIACDPRPAGDRHRLVVVVTVAVVIVAASLAAVPFAARYSTSHGPVFIGARDPGSLSVRVRLA
jgi:membrane associated rhomboid family serine protease